MAELREQGKTYGQIAAIFGISEKAVSWHCLRLGADPPNPPPCRLDYHEKHPVLKRGNGVVRAFTPAEDARLLELESQGATVSEIARALGRRWNSTRGRLMTLARRDARAEP